MKSIRQNKIWAALLLVVLLGGLPAVHVYAQTDYSEGYFIYQDRGTYASVKEYFGEESRVVIPSALGGKPVAEIEAEAFTGAGTVKELVIPDTVVTIGEGALDGIPRVEYQTSEEPETQPEGEEPSKPDKQSCPRRTENSRKRNLRQMRQNLPRIRAGPKMRRHLPAEAQTVRRAGTRRPAKNIHWTGRRIMSRSQKMDTALCFWRETAQMPLQLSGGRRKLTLLLTGARQPPVYGFSPFLQLY